MNPYTGAQPANDPSIDRETGTTPDGPEEARADADHREPDKAGEALPAQPFGRVPSLNGTHPTTAPGYSSTHETLRCLPADPRRERWTALTASLALLPDPADGRPRPAQLPRDTRRGGPAGTGGPLTAITDSGSAVGGRRDIRCPARSLALGGTARDGCRAGRSACLVRGLPSVATGPMIFPVSLLRWLSLSAVAGTGTARPEVRRLSPAGQSWRVRTRTGICRVVLAWCSPRVGCSATSLGQSSARAVSSSSSAWAAKVWVPSSTVTPGSALRL